MTSSFRLIVAALFGAIVLGAYAVSTAGVGAGSLKDARTMADFRRDCPDYARTRSGDCMGTTFRSYYLMRNADDGSFGSGK